MKALRCLAAALAAWIGCAFGQDFTDDAALSSAFEEKLGKVAAAGGAMPLGKAQKALEKTWNGKLPAPESQPAAAGRGGLPGSFLDSAMAAVVAVGTVYKCGECEKWHQGGFSSGWIFSPDGLVVTNAHVFEGREGDVPGVMLRDGSVFPIAGVLGGDRDADVAVFRIDAGGRRLPALRLAGGASVGEQVYVVSHPQGRLWSLTAGLISRFHRQDYGGDGRATDWMAITADFAGGSSGGPVLNARGEVVGMVSSTTTAYSDPSECKEHPGPEVQMVFKDCVPLKELKGFLDSAAGDQTPP